MKKIHVVLFVFLISLAAISVYVFSLLAKNDETLKIAISKASPIESYSAYTDWIHAEDPTIETLDMYQFSIDSALQLLEECSGLLLTGGPDIYPGNYGMESEIDRCGEFDLKRDSLEFALIARALELDLPILGICRGQQILNVALGGTLYIDIPSDYDTTVQHRKPNTYDCFHNVMLEDKSKLAWAAHTLIGKVKSRHHQAINSLADKLKVTARASDGIIEAVEWKNIGERSFLMGVQWHPEQMDWSNPFSKSVLEYFILEVKSVMEDID